MWVQRVTGTDLVLVSEPALERTFLTLRGARIFFLIVFPCCLVIPYSFVFFFFSVLPCLTFGSCVMLGFKEQERPKVKLEFLSLCSFSPESKLLGKHTSEFWWSCQTKPKPPPLSCSGGRMSLQRTWRNEKPFAPS